MALGAGILIARQITRPVDQLATAARRVVEGDLATPVQVSTRDEIGLLGNVFHLMVDRLRVSHRSMVDVLVRALESREGEAGSLTRLARNNPSTLPTFAPQFPYFPPPCEPAHPAPPMLLTVRRCGGASCGCGGWPSGRSRSPGARPCWPRCRRRLSRRPRRFPEPASGGLASTRFTVTYSVSVGGHGRSRRADVGGRPSSSPAPPPRAPPSAAPARPC